MLSFKRIEKNQEEEDSDRKVNEYRNRRFEERSLRRSIFLFPEEILLLTMTFSNVLTVGKMNTG